MEGVCIMLGQKPDWDTAKKVVLADGGFLDKLKTYDKDNIKEEVLVGAVEAAIAVVGAEEEEKDLELETN